MLPTSRFGDTISHVGESLPEIKLVLFKRKGQIGRKYQKLELVKTIIHDNDAKQKIGKDVSRYEFCAECVIALFECPRCVRFRPNVWRKRSFNSHFKFDVNIRLLEIRFFNDLVRVI